MHPIRQELYPGITLNVLDDSRFKTNYISLSFLCDMTKENAAVSHLLPMVLGRGSERYPNLGAINRALEMIWDGTLDSGTGRMGETRVIGFSACYPDDRFIPGSESIEDKTLDIFFDILFFPKSERGVFLTEYTESEKEKLIQRIATQTNAKGKYADTRLRETLCQNEPYGLPSAGSIEQVQSVTPEELYDFYRQMLRSFPLEIIYIGRTPFEVISQKLKARLALLDHPKMPLSGTTVIRSAAEIRRVEEALPGKQGHLRLGFRTDCTLQEEHFAAFAMMNEILGGCPVSLLFTNVREKQSLCYYCHSAPNSLKGLLTIGAGIRDENRDTAEEAILAQVAAMQAGNFDQAQIDAALYSIESALRGITDSRGTVESFLLRRLLAGADISIEHYLAALQKVTKEDIVAAARRLTLDTVYYLKPDIGASDDVGGDEDVL
ncbi:MAG: insulinase family protein [Ruminococcaceae bacterium]|nr:insulinase family protein [Oscillospiraceae bacterium]